MDLFNQEQPEKPNADEEKHQRSKLKYYYKEDLSIRELAVVMGWPYAKVWRVVKEMGLGLG